MLGSDIEAFPDNIRSSRNFPTLPHIPPPIPYTIFMQLSAFTILPVLAVRRIRLSPLLVCGAYVLCRTLHSLWSSLKKRQLLAITDRALARRELCESCREKAFACRGCLLQIYDVFLRPGSMECYHQIVTAYGANEDKRKAEVITIGGTD